MFKSLLHYKNRSKFPQNVHLEIKKSGVSLGEFEQVLKNLVNLGLECTHEQSTVYQNDKLNLQIFGGTGVTKCFERKVQKEQVVNGFDYMIYETYFRKTDHMQPSFNNKTLSYDSIVFDNKIYLTKCTENARKLTTLSITIDATAMTVDSLEELVDQIAFPTPAAASVTPAGTSGTAGTSAGTASVTVASSLSGLTTARAGSKSADPGTVV